ncbi:hypothetical protein N802_09045 [Knoellia sinensis KCTC 19936]|uniref:Uncharacterized protein n=1 Tax=Knoellia sinensis KCTC 19936 TaxID=1385520 RepID=A0A0A0JB35_9MICO|nr:hypothetical protein N802_09045 [Knoellia sinensis KCTC 19936]
MPACALALDEAFARAVGRGRWAARFVPGTGAGTSARGVALVADFGADFGADLRADCDAADAAFRAAGRSAAFFDVAGMVASGAAAVDSSGVERRRARSPEARAAPAASVDGFADFRVVAFFATLFAADDRLDATGAFFLGVGFGVLDLVVAISASLAWDGREPAGLPRRRRRGHR